MALKCPRCQSGFNGFEMDAERREESRRRWGNFGLVILAIAAIVWWLDQPGSIEWLAQKTIETENFR